MPLNEILFPIISLGGLGAIFGILLGYASKKFAVEVDEKIVKIRECLPGANCGGCGFAGCDAYAKAVSDGKAPANLCTPGGPSASKKIGSILGISVETSEPKVAFVKCKGSCKIAKEKYNYYGVQDCRQAVVAPGGGAKACDFGCLGLGSCVTVCKFNSIQIIDGIAVINENTCTGCSACIQICPKNVIELVPASKHIRIACNSHEKGKSVKDICSKGCIGCTICAKNCPENAITMIDNLPVIDFNRCTQCKVCVEKCPTKAILDLI
ncbi:electron transport complex, RnfABCDGE type, B subunit [Clostridium sp. USBA 49]|jgi:RnfABCDGE-type electron transport complex B subunit|uniref:RnfABCDGE type electron transport complex subunit B n=1 Tax=Clostridium TaxID=1485 RepID=UPI0009999624|nr:MULTISPECIES: RnfABCDGE type electron transport complex subunit B [Clostridium]SKA80753.1 electron transport complex, RnfABCDGE type, B subunit [Clostridium sp. USBA 49]